MPYIAIPGILFLRDIIDWYHRTSFITNHNCLTSQDHMIQSEYNKSWSNDQLQTHSGRNVVVVHLFHRQLLTSGGSPSYHRRPAVHLRGPDAPFHSLAIWIARDTAMSTLKYSQTNTSVSTHNFNKRILSSRFICIKLVLVHKHLVKDSSCANLTQVGTLVSFPQLSCYSSPISSFKFNSPVTSRM